MKVIKPVRSSSFQQLLARRTKAGVSRTVNMVSIYGNAVLPSNTENRAYADAQRQAGRLQLLGTPTGRATWLLARRGCHCHCGQECTTGLGGVALRRRLSPESERGLNIKGCHPQPHQQEVKAAPVWSTYPQPCSTLHRYNAWSILNRHRWSVLNRRQQLKNGYMEKNTLALVSRRPNFRSSKYQLNFGFFGRSTSRSA